MENTNDELEFLTSSMYSIDLRGKVGELKEHIKDGMEFFGSYLKRLAPYKDKMFDEIKENAYFLKDSLIETAKYTLPGTAFYFSYKKTKDLGYASLLEGIKQMGSLGLTGILCLPFLVADTPQKLVGPFALGLYSALNFVLAAAYVGGQLQDELTQKAEERKKREK